VLASFVQTVMANSELIHYVFDKAASGLRDPDALTMMREVVESGGFVVNPTMRTISLRLNLGNFSFFRGYEEFQDLRLWYFGPDLLGGTRNYTLFRLMAGIGTPTDSW
jgi:hypothetical protein